MASVLIIDDDPHVRGLLRSVLERAGHDIVEASDGTEGTSLYRRDPADVVITDIIMPEKGGWETILELRREFPDVKVIAISGGGKLGPFSYLMLARRFGARYIFSKPVGKDSLLAAVQDILEGGSQAIDATGYRFRQALEKKTILLVDKDPQHTWRLCETLTRVGHSVTDVPKPEYALDMLKDRRFDIAIVDVLSARAGDEDLIETLRSTWPSPLIIAMADFQALAVRKAVIRRGAHHFVDKPVDPDLVLSIISPPEAFSGQVQGVDILEYIQFLMLSGGRCVLEIVSHGKASCRLYFDRGNLVHAASETAKGEEAFYLCTKYQGGMFVNMPWIEPEEVTIDKPGDLLLLEAARRRDEIRGPER